MVEALFNPGEAVLDVNDLISYRVKAHFNAIEMRIHAGLDTRQSFVRI